MTREEKISAIYKEMANKDRTFGCLYIVKNREGNTYKARETEGECVDLTYGSEYQIEYGNDMTETNYLESIIGHPVMIGDVLDWIEPYGRGYAQDVKFSRERKRKIDITILQWDKKREPIEEQSDGCIDYVYSLIQK